MWQLPLPKERSDDLADFRDARRAAHEDDFVDIRGLEIAVLHRCSNGFQQTLEEIRVDALELVSCQLNPPELECS